MGFSMILEISDKTLKQTTKCLRNFQCLTSESREMCLIDSHLQENVLLIKERAHTKTDCSYMRVFGYSYTVYVCTCPTRREIYERYNM